MTTVLEQMLEKGNLPASLLLTGRVDREMALDLAKKLLGALENHPDLHIFSPEEKSELHSMENIRKLIHEMGLPPFKAKNKVFIIEQAEKMLPSASNALLKTLEEPNEDCFLILWTHREEALLSTIRSRLFPIHFPLKAPISLDLTPFFSLAKQGNWHQLMQELPSLESQEPDTLFQACLQWACEQKSLPLFEKTSLLITQAATALEHNLKLRTVMLNLFFHLV